MRCFCVVIWILLSEVAVVVSDISVSEHVGGSVTIQCPHWFARTNTKYFCRDPCEKDQHMLIKSGQSPTGRYTLEDSGNGDITVTIIDLQTSDAGTYWCGVDRLVKDTYHEVLLTVTVAPSTHKHPPKATPTAAAVRTVRSEIFTTSSSTISSSSAPKPTFPAQHSLRVSSPTREILLYVAAGLVTMIVFSIAAVIYTGRGPKRRSKLQSDLISAMSSTAGLEEEDLHSHVCFTVINCSAGFTSETLNNQALDNLLYSTEKGLLAHVIYSLDR
ncbi:CMRF35-like molecule 6 [Pygocentrus nattereri]|uniref:CMRF35-like molecule 6 n=1 Tax=Pygocentrus nattereri TaxID=42514 RepID=UPI0018918EBB|nr:CMRF35-like molecule 6 [Pygocentrus nattereri]